MHRAHILRSRLTTAVLLMGCAWLIAGTAEARIDGVTGTSPNPVFNFEARADAHIQASDGATLLIWGYSVLGQETQYPGPTLIVTQNDRVTINLKNWLTVPTSIVFPGQSSVTTVNGAPGLLTSEAAANGGTVSYSFVASHPGTYLYHSGTDPELQIEMGLVGVIIVRPTAYDAVTNKIAYQHVDTAYDREYLFLLTEMDHRVHEKVEFGQMAAIDNTQWFPYYWFINGRNAPDTMAEAYSPDLPHQPYNCVPRAHPGEKVLMRIVGGGRDMHPFHHHGNSSTLIAKDGRLIARDPSTGPDLATEYFTIPTWPGSTYDTIWHPWTGEGLGWDIYPETTTAATALPWEDPAYQGIGLPVELPDQSDLAFGSWYAGSPFLGTMGSLPPGNPGFNIYGGIAFMWHSHNEKELTTNDIFPGGMFTMMIVEPPGAPID